MVRYTLDRCAWALSVLFVVSLLAFWLNSLVPGDPARLILQASGVEIITPEALQAKHAEMHLDDPLPVRYAAWLGRAVQGDLGVSYRSYEPITSLYLSRIGATGELAAATVAIAIVFSVPLGVLAAFHRNGPVDAIAQLTSILFSALPSFWVALLGILLFAVVLHWLPAFGTPTANGIILPAVVLALPTTALLTRLTRAAMLDALSHEYVVTARAKGLREARVAWRHVLPNALVPIVTVLTLELANLMTGAAVVEYVFAWPGIGKLVLDAVQLGDIPIVAGFTVAAGIIFVFLNLAADLSVASLDPRLRSTR